MTHLHIHFWALLLVLKARFHSQRLNFEFSPSNSKALSKFLNPSFPATPSPRFIPRDQSCAADAPNIVYVRSEDELKSAYSKAEAGDESPPAIFYFLAMQICSCRLISNVIWKTSKDYPEVTENIIYFKEVDIESALRNLNHSSVSVPTVQFFQNGKKVAEVIGDDEVLVRKTCISLQGKKNLTKDCE